MKRFYVVAVLSALGIFGAICAKTGLFFDFESGFAALINPNGESSAFFRVFTELGEFYGVISVVAVLLIFKNRLRLAVPAGLCALCSCLTNEVLKRIIARPRPDEALRLLEVSGYSFPSGHAMSNAAFYTALIICLFGILKTKPQKAAVAILLTAITLIIGLSRIYFNVHYLFDVLSGFCIGTAISVALCPLFLELFGSKRKV